MGRGFGIAANVDHEVMKQVARAAEAAGFSSFWVNDTPGNDGLAGLAAAASVTSTINLGVGVIPLERRPATEIAGDVKRLDLPQDRLLLGIGSSSRKGGLAKIHDGADTLHDELTCKVIIAALGPNMCAMAGTAGDGVLFNWLLPAWVDKSRTLVEDAAKEAGKPEPLIASYVRAALLPAAGERLKSEAGRYTGVPSYAAHFERQGVPAEQTAVFGEDAATLQSQIAEYESRLDETVIRAITATDSADDILVLLEATKP